MQNHVETNFVRRHLRGIASIGLAVFALASARASADVIYDFVSASDQAVLASLDLTSLPAGSAQFHSETLTPAGIAAFGFPSDYVQPSPIAFVNSGGDPAEPRVIDNGSGRLVSDPPVGPDGGSGQNANLVFPLLAGTSSTFPTADQYGWDISNANAAAGLSMVAISNGLTAQAVHGDWLSSSIVPEPASLSLLAAGGLALLGRRRARPSASM